MFTHIPDLRSSTFLESCPQHFCFGPALGSAVAQAQTADAAMVGFLSARGEPRYRNGAPVPRARPKAPFPEQKDTF